MKIEVWLKGNLGRMCASEVELTGKHRLCYHNREVYEQVEVAHHYEEVTVEEVPFCFFFKKRKNVIKAAKGTFYADVSRITIKAISDS